MDGERKPGGQIRPSVALVGRFVPYVTGQMPNEKYLADALERQGAIVHRISILDRPAAVGFPPLTLGILCGPQAYECSSVLRGHGSTMAFWTLDAPDAFRRRSRFDFISSTCHLVFASADWGLGSRNGVPFVRLPAAVPEEPVEFAPNPKRPIAFLGGMYSHRRRMIADTVRGFGGEVKWDWAQRIYGEALVRYVQETKIVLGDNWTNDHPGYWSSRNYILPGIGAFLLTAAVPGMEAEFEIGKHLAVWTNPEDLAQKIRYYLEHEEEREAVRRAGFDYCRSVHTWDARAKIVLAAFRDFVRHRTSGPALRGLLIRSEEMARRTLRQRGGA